MNAVGIHVFAGGFSLGVREVMPVKAQLERHNFGVETARSFSLEVLNEESGEWPRVDAQFAFGNPRCTGFSCLTSGYDGNTHGPWARCTQDIHDLCRYAVGNECDIVIWESVQQAYSTGRPLLNYLRDEVFVPKHYRIAHLFIDAMSMGNCQHRRRYFFVAYRDDRNFNVSPPLISTDEHTLYDAIWDLRNRETSEYDGSEWQADNYCRLSPGERHSMPHLPNGWSLNTLGRYAPRFLSELNRVKWEHRTSEMPFSLHCIKRLHWMRPCPTLYSSCCRMIHPTHDRPLTVRELSHVMGWGDRCPVGEKPAAQLAKGVVPAAGKWLAEQALAYLNGAWGREDWESSYSSAHGEWVGDDADGRVEKVFNLTRYVGMDFERDRFNPDARLPAHILEVSKHELSLPYDERSIHVHSEEAA